MQAFTAHHVNLMLADFVMDANLIFHRQHHRLGAMRARQHHLLHLSVLININVFCLLNELPLLVPPEKAPEAEETGSKEEERAEGDDHYDYDCGVVVWGGDRWRWRWWLEMREVEVVVQGISSHDMIRVCMTTPGHKMQHPNSQNKGIKNSAEKSMVTPFLAIDHSLGIDSLRPGSLGGRQEP
ncbi:hypothetical protein Cgig2_013207 [Carnegiea gigantea]|uniref:Uncharacterized protein n=1 Tax=Carnegiea gigantea TaxID=171969 RepID=A0A9Q1GSZ7_9CARY|nr:hypothetical protein Cgig2_020709 [Carnegiea gigantea]KAJ8446906.1 hypothetical protein Cgig2_013207 [Carnegiea gigantea]